MRPPISSRRRSRSLEVQKRPALFPSSPFTINLREHRRIDLERPPISRPMQMAPPQVDTSYLPALPHTSDWMQVADHVVGRHPHGKPLSTRVATHAEIALISGHVNIPWAYTHTGTKKTQPSPVKVQKPATVYAPLSIVPSLALEDLGNIQGLHIWRAVNNNAKLFKGKSLRHARGTENIPMAPTPAYL
jgi:hypothetical protein